jgi:hypothetical protein
LTVLLVVVTLFAPTLVETWGEVADRRRQAEHDQPAVQDLRVFAGEVVTHGALKATAKSEPHRMTKEPTRSRHDTGGDIERVLRGVAVRSCES